MLSMFKIEPLSNHKVVLLPYFLEKIKSSDFGEESKNLSNGIWYLKYGYSFYFFIWKYHTLNIKFHIDEHALKFKKEIKVNNLWRH